MRATLAYGMNDRTLPFLARNCIIEKLPTGLSSRRRPGLELHATIAGLHIRGVFWKAGLFDDQVILVVGTQVWRVRRNGVATQISGTVAGADRVDIDGGLDIDGVATLRIATGDALYKVTEAGGVVEEDFPDATRPGCSSVAYLKGHFIASKADTDEVYYLIPGGSTWAALEFASAEYGADIVQGLYPLGDYLHIFGAATVEPWRLTGDSSTVIAPVQGLAEDFGCRARDTIAATNGLMFVVDDQCQVRMTRGGTWEIISDDWLTKKIAAVEAMHLRAWACTWRGHPLYILTLGTSGGTVVFDASGEVRLWSEWSSKDETYFRGHMGVEAEATVYVADAAFNSGKLWKFDESAYSDNGDEIEHLVTAYLPLKEGRLQVGNAVLDCELGVAPQTGQGSEPLVGLRYSDDGGRAWSNWQYRSTGARGHYKHHPRWNRQGQVKSPHGRLWQIRTSDPALSVVHGLDVNVP